jgi:hypothetical protein
MFFSMNLLAIVANIPEIEHSIYLSTYSSIALVDRGRFFSFLIYTQSVGVLGQGISPSQGGYLRTEQHKHRKNAHRHA